LSQALARQCQDALGELTLLAPWLVTPAAPGDFEDPLNKSSAISAIRRCANWQDLGRNACRPRSSTRRTDNTAERIWLDERRQHITQASAAPNGAWRRSNTWRRKPASRQYGI